MNEIAARVYVLNSSDAPALKKILEYDPYLDQNLLPKLPKKWEDADDKYFAAHPEEKAEADKLKKQLGDAAEKLKNDKDANIIFARQDYQLRDGISMGLDREKSYLYLSADDAFLDSGETKLKKSVSSLQRAQKDVEKKVISTIEEERQKSDSGLGLIFG
ncbi:MAG: hypothetical protein M1286_04235 [Candidatus Marsarchaeota archaeon]|nr:hypothetical protein [Candidatus Marsarchaeota archaeon]